MVSNLAIGNKGPKRNLFPFISQMQTTYFYGNFGHAVNQKAGVPVQAGTYQTYWSVPYCKDLSATVLRSLDRRGPSWPLCDIVYIASEQNAGQEVRGQLAFMIACLAKCPGVCRVLTGRCPNAVV